MLPKTDEYIPYYKEMLEVNLIDETQDLHPFFCQVGNNYFNNDKKILFVGKSVNGWVTNNRNVDDLFDMNNEGRIINRNDQMEWVKNLEGTNDIYNTKKSAFWRVVKQFTCLVTQKNDWYNQIAWTNLYKVSPKTGNPTARLKFKQLEQAKKILFKDIEILQPSVIVFLCSGWEIQFLQNTKLSNDYKSYYEWNKYKTFYKICDRVLVIYSHHPQGKSEGSHVDALNGIINQKV